MPSRRPRLVHIPLALLLPACAGTAQVGPETTARLASLETQTASLEARNRAQAEQIALLRGQLALAQAEAREARLGDAPREVVRIRGTVGGEADTGWIDQDTPDAAEPAEPTTRAPVTEEALDPPTPPRAGGDADDGPRPVLRLHGVGAMPLAGTPAVRESLPPGPLTPPSVHAVVGLPFPPPAAPAAGPSQAMPATTAPTSALPPVVLGRAAPADAQVARDTYRTALGHVTSRRFEQAVPALTAFLDRFPGHPYRDNALFWRATSYYAMRRYTEALGDFQRVVAEFPSGPKVPDALLQIGLCHQRLGDTARARTYFERVRREFPQSVAARLAAREDTT